MVETGLNKTEIGKIILAACFINDLGTVLALGLIFANYNVWLAAFAGATAVSLWFLPRFAPWFFNKVGHRVSEPETKFIALILFLLGGMGSIAGSEAVLPAYLVGMVLAPTFQKDPGLAHRMRVVAFTILTPFYFLKAGSLVDFQAVIAGAGLIAVFLALEDGDQVRRHPAADAVLQLRSPGRDVHDAADVDRTDVRDDFRPLWAHQPHHRSAAVHHPGDRGHRQRGGADADRTEMVRAFARACRRARGGILCL